jgi:molybdate transport system substrate-binding protein
MDKQHELFSIPRLIRGLLAVTVVATAWGAGLARAADLTIFSAVSTTGAMTKIGSMFEAKTGKKIQFSFGATSTLARQIERGAPVDIFLSADHVWMNYLQDRKLIDTGSRVDILGNSLVLITPLNSDLKIKIAKGFNLAELLKGKRIAMGDPDHTAVGIYAKESLTNLGVWSQIEPMLARADSVRASLAMVERGEVGAGILFGTEAAVSKNVRLVDTFPAESHKAITYPVALLAKARVADARTFVSYLKTLEAEEVFRQFGFNLLK